MSFDLDLLCPKRSQPPFSQVGLGPACGLPNHFVSDINAQSASHIPPAEGALKPVNELEKITSGL
jgi:hypothetical protein